ncbi:hypothetical protein V1525DRAFT_381593 [Lipomyces kononenkoae]|uniref:Uncharacterized protein n=1 Tax=Lipomyces kononenkoae TaxID=34357 RepID=A0ACC3SUV4_LIPKO
MEPAMVASDPVATRFRFHTHFDRHQWSSSHSFFPYKDIFHEIPPPRLVGEHGNIPPCEVLNKHKFLGVPVAVFLLALAIFFSIRRLERRRDRLATCILDLVRQLIATAVARSLFIFAVKTSVDSEEYYSDPIVCRLSVVSLVFETLIGLPLLYLSHKFIYAVARRISLGRAKYVPNDEVARVGLQSGNYGNPVRIRLFIKQTLLLCSASTFTFSFVSFLMHSAKGLDSRLEIILLGWTWHMGPGAEKIMLKGVYPVFFWTIQYMIIDRMIRYRPQTARKSQGDLEAALDRYERDARRAGIEVGSIHERSSDAPVQLVENTMAHSHPDTSRDPAQVTHGGRLPLPRPQIEGQQYSATPTPPASSSVESSRNFIFPSTSTPASILATLLTPPMRPSSSTSSAAAQSSATPSNTVAQNPVHPVPPSYIPSSIPAHYDPLNAEPGTEDELPTYADSQRQALETGDRDRQRIMDLKRH